MKKIIINYIGILMGLALAAFGVVAFILPNGIMIGSATGIGLSLIHIQIKFYIGFDPTADCLHVGHFMQVIIMMYMQKYGHTPVAVSYTHLDVYKRQGQGRLFKAEV